MNSTLETLPDSSLSNCLKRSMIRSPLTAMYSFRILRGLQLDIPSASSFTSTNTNIVTNTRINTAVNTVTNTATDRVKDTKTNTLKNTQAELKAVQKPPLQAH